MVSINLLYKTDTLLLEEISKYDLNTNCFVQVLTSEMIEEEAIVLAKFIKRTLPNSQIIGSSVCSIIHDGEIYDKGTLIVIEIYDSALITSGLISTDNKDGETLCHEMVSGFDGEKPNIVRAYFGGYYNDVHLFADTSNRIIASVPIVGGTSGNIMDNQEVVPYVFDSEKAVSKGFAFGAVLGETLSVVTSANTSHVAVSPVYKITEVDEEAIVSIENEPAYEWLEKNLGTITKDDYDNWEDRVAMDTLTRFQLLLEDKHNASRFVYYDPIDNKIKQYYSKSPENLEFRISYTSPTKSIEETYALAVRLLKEPAEQIFCYSCLFRKLFLSSFAKAELLPFKNNGIYGAFMLGEIGYTGGRNELLNGSCMVVGIAENKSYIVPDMHAFDTLSKIRTESNALTEFIETKKIKSRNEENKSLVEKVLLLENESRGKIYTDPIYGLPNIMAYERDCAVGLIGKSCLVTINNSELIIRDTGKTNYISRVRNAFSVGIAHCARETDVNANMINVYISGEETFIITASEEVSDEKFIELLEASVDMIYGENRVRIKGQIPVIASYIVVLEKDENLEKAYSYFRAKAGSQEHFSIYDPEKVNLMKLENEINILETIHYALDTDKIIPYYQKINCNYGNGPNRYEALMRIEDEKGEVHPPLYFMEISKKYRLYLRLSKKMIEKVLEDFKGKDEIVSINISAFDIETDEMREFLLDSIIKFPKPENLTIEILESEYIKDEENIRNFIEIVRKTGVKIAIDDFGSGYSNLLEIVKIKPDFIKVDGQIIKDIDKERDNELILEVIVKLAKKMSVDLVAEFVETQEIQDKLESYGVRYSQGYYFAKPKPKTELGVK